MALSVARYNVFGVGETAGFGTEADASALVQTMLSAAEELIAGAYARLSGEQLLVLAQGMESVSRKLWAAQVRAVHEIDQQGLASARSCSSTGSLLRQALNIPIHEARLRVTASQAILPQALPSGGETPPRHELLAAAVDAGLVHPDHVRTVVDTMRDFPTDVDPELLIGAEQALVGHAVDIDPDQFRKVAAHLLEVLTPDGKGPEPEFTLARVEFSIGSRSAATGLTSVSGRFDDLSIEVLRRTIDGLSGPKPEVDGIKDLRPAAMRRAHALVEALNHVLTSGALPEQGRERPQVVVTVPWKVLQGVIGTATLDSGATLSPAAARQVLCDASILPAVLGGDGQVLDLGRSSRTFNRATRRAIAVRDKGCCFPGCDRPVSWSEYHHVKWWHRDGGRSSYDNGCLLCPYHHSVIHLEQWTLEMSVDGFPEFTPPLWLDPHQRKRRNTLHHLAPEFDDEERTG